MIVVDHRDVETVGVDDKDGDQEKTKRKLAVQMRQIWPPWGGWGPTKRMDANREGGTRPNRSSIPIPTEGFT